MLVCEKWNRERTICGIVFESVNTRGLPIYAKMWLMDNSDSAMTLHAEKNVLTICNRPSVLIKGTMTTSSS